MHDAECGDFLSDSSYGSSIPARWEQHIWVGGVVLFVAAVHLHNRVGFVDELVDDPRHKLFRPLLQILDFLPDPVGDLVFPGLPMPHGPS